jgi:hypothetical protein
MSTNQPNRVLAVEIRAARLGYAVFENPKQLCDFGAAWYEVPGEARQRIARLLGLLHPSVLILRGGIMRYPRNMRNRRRIARIARDEAKKFGISIASITEKEFAAYFERHSCRDKYDVATVLAVRFPELAWRVPSRPKFFNPEPRPLLYFDSIALGIAYLELTSKDGQKQIDEDGILSPAPRWRS